MSEEAKPEAADTTEKKDAERYWEARPPTERGHFQFDLPPNTRVVKIESLPFNK